MGGVTDAGKKKQHGKSTACRNLGKKLGQSDILWGHLSKQDLVGGNKAPAGLRDANATNRETCIPE